MSTQVSVDRRGEALKGDGRKMKVAVVTDDLKTVSPHFGMAGHYLVYMVEAGGIVGKETRHKASHAAGMHDHHGSGEATSEMTNIHNEMLHNVSDCATLIAGGMGKPMYSAIRSAGMNVFITRMRDADEAVKALLEGRLDNHPELLH
jgi:predicted Fe-Mo cluster-binding NifX family protein